MNLEGIDKTLESKVRLGIMSVLAVNDSVDFVTLKSLLELTDGNLVTHLRNLETAGYLTNALTESENSLADQLGSVYRQLLNLSRIDEKLTEKLLLDCDTIQESINALSSDISDLASRVDLDAEALAAIENRLSDIFTLKRRYGPSLEQVLDARDEARKRLKDFTDARKHREEFDRREKELEAELKTAAETLSKLRRKAAEKFAREVQGKLGAIGFARCTLAVDFSEIPPCPSGMDRIEFMFSANAGENSQPLRRIASIKAS